jgi:hypothetical protein
MEGNFTMNQLSKQRLKLSKKNLGLFKKQGLVAAMVTGSIAKGYGDDNSDIDTVLYYEEPFSKHEFDKIVKDAHSSGGDLFHGTPEEGFAVFYYVDGVKCDFGIGKHTEQEELITEMLTKPEIDLTKHLMISGFVDGFTLLGDTWVEKWKNKAREYPEKLRVMMVNHFKKFHPVWVIEKMAIERNDNLFFSESIVEMIGNMIGILCGINRMYHPGKLKGLEWTIDQMKIKPKNFYSRYNEVLLNRENAVENVYCLVREILDLIDKHLPEVSTDRNRKLLDQKLRK